MIIHASSFMKNNTFDLNMIMDKLLKVNNLSQFQSFVYSLGSWREQNIPNSH